MLSKQLEDWLHSFSGSAANDMCEGGGDAECVTEICFDCMSCYEPALHKELQAAIKEHGYKAVFKEACKHVCTL